MDLQICDLRNWTDGLVSLFKALGIENPVTDLGVPLTDGIPSFVKIQSGHVTYDHIDTMPTHLQGMRFSVDTGWCQRNNEGVIIAYLELVAPFAQMQNFNRTLGLSGMHAICTDEKISQDSTRPSIFSFRRQITLPRGAGTIDFASGQEIVLSIPVVLDSDFEALGVIDGFQFSGEFSAYLQPQFSERINMRGRFEITFEPDLKARHREHFE